jgi:hypothetical protein
LGSATVPVAATGVPPVAFEGKVFGQRPKTAGETPALPANISFTDKLLVST